MEKGSKVFVSAAANALHHGPDLHYQYFSALYHTLLIFVLVAIPPLAYFLAIIKIKEGHISWLYQATVTLLVVWMLIFVAFGPDGPDHMYGLDMLCILFTAASAVVFHCKGVPQGLNDYIVSAFTPTGGSSHLKWLKFYSIVLAYIGFTFPLLFFVLAIGTSDVDNPASYDVASLAIMCAMVCTFSNAIEALRKNSRAGAEAGEEGRIELDGYMKEAGLEEEQEPLVSEVSSPKPPAGPAGPVPPGASQV